MKESIVIINNEKCIETNKQVYCENIEMKSIPEALESFFDINLILRKGKINPVHKIEVMKIYQNSLLNCKIKFYYHIYSKKNFVTKNFCLIKKTYC